MNEVTRVGQRHINQGRGFKEVKTIIIEPPNLFPEDAGKRPNGALAQAYLGGALLEAGFDVTYLDATVGTDDQTLDETFYKKRAPDNRGLVYLGMDPDEVVKAVRDSDMVLVSNIFTPQTETSLAIGRAIKNAYPEKLLVAGGVNPRSLPKRFLEAGYDAVGVGEAEKTVVDLATALSLKNDWKGVSGLLYQNERTVLSSGPSYTETNLDKSPMPAFHLWPLKKYWHISAPHGGDFPAGLKMKYASLQTSQGCPFECSFCHISLEKEDGSGIGNLRLKSLDRVLREAQTLKGLGADWIFLEDDSLLAKKRRVTEIFKEFVKLDLKLADVNGVNLVHLFKKGRSGKLEVDRELLETMVEAGFKQLVLPFESNSPRIIKRWATNKWDPVSMDVAELVRVANELGLKVPGNFMIGFPDQTVEELRSEVEFAGMLKSEGLAYASFFIVIPYPGSALYNYAINNGHLDPNFDPSVFHWGQPVMKNTLIPPEELVRVRKEEWKRINGPDFVANKNKLQVVQAPF